MSPLPVVPVIVGPTASGKSAVALTVARRLNGEVISADSRQIYRGMDIGTAKPSKEERTEIPHHFVDELPPDREFNAGEFGDAGRKLIAVIARRGRVPIVAGGSGLYIRSLIDGFFEGPGADKAIRASLQERLEASGMEPLLRELREIDPVSAERIDPTKPRRVIRALEVFHLTGQPLSMQQEQRKIPRDFRPLLFGLLWERAALYRRIEERCDRMLAEGLLDEIDRLEKKGLSPALNALNTVGYVEGFSYRRGEIGYAEMVRLMKQNSRRYAKRQMTWFRRDERISWLPVASEHDLRAAAGEIVRRVKSAMQPQNLGRKR